MGFSRAQKAESRERILDLAAQQLKERGLESIAIADLMKRAGLTQGAFYGHFVSRDELLLEATRHGKKNPQRILREVEESKPEITLEDVLDVFLRESHIRNPGSGCVVCALAGEAKSAAPEIRQELDEVYQGQIAFVEKSLRGASRRQRAVGILSALIGAVSLARSLSDPEIVDTLLAQTRTLILDAQKAYAQT